MGVKNKIIRGIYEFHPEYWTKVSDEAKDFVTRLLTVDMSARMTAEQALLHPWVCSYCYIYLTCFETSNYLHFISSL